MWSLCKKHIGAAVRRPAFLSSSPAAVSAVATSAAQSYPTTFISSPSPHNSYTIPNNTQLYMHQRATFVTRTTPCLMGLEEFRDTVSRQKRMDERVGRQWSVRELRRKSYDDLHKLWLVLYKERNMLMTELQISRRRQIIFPQPDRMKKVRKSMGAIRHVLGERKIAAIASFRERQMLQELEAQNTQAETGENDDDDDMMEGEGHSAMDDESEAIEDSKSTSDGAPDKK